ncbi:MAG TPA: diguanylate cyclase [Terracidiphilus sp.]|nr:diguanylate cyclase [Terracidiphilus sp.]
MISLKEYLDASTVVEADVQPEAAIRHSQSPDRECSQGPVRESDRGGILALALAAYRSALREMGSYSLEACPALGQGLKQGLGKVAEGLTPDAGQEAVEAAQGSVQGQLNDWGQRTAAHYRQKTAEVKDLLLVMARTAESVGERDQRCAGQLSEVTTRLKTIASLEDLTEIRSSLERSAADLKTSVDRMTEGGKRAIAQLKAEVSGYQVKLEEAEELASRDALTGLRNRAWVEGQMERRIAKGTPLSVAIVDIDDFKRVNDRYGHLVGDELLQQFSTELKTASRATDVIGRWGGDEFILVLDCGLAEAGPQIDRLSAWVCQDYAVHARTGAMKLKVDASIGLAERAPGETMKDMLARADAAMYAHKPASRTQRSASRR